MLDMPSWATGAALIVALSLGAIGVVVNFLFGARVGKYRARALMTDNELEFFFRLSKALPHHLVFPPGFAASAGRGSQLRQENRACRPSQDSPAARRLRGLQPGRRSPRCG